MKLIRFGPVGEEKPGILTDAGVRKDMSGQVTDWNRAFFNGGGLKRLAQAAAGADDLPDVPEGARWGSPIARPGKIICIGLNYSDHAAETGAEPPKEPIIFFKATTAMVGPYDVVRIPRGSKKTDWEVELGVVIGRDARYLESPEEAAEAIAGYTICNDLSERHFQLERGGQWVKGKSCDTFNPTGPYLATPDQVGDVGDLNMTLEVNGERRQSGNTSTMIFDVAYIVHYISQFMTLEAGDLISTGTPPGVGMGMKPQQFLKAGDEMRLTIDKLGEQRQRCEPA